MDTISAEKLLEQALKYDKSQTKEIIALLERARVMEPKNVDVLYNLGVQLKRRAVELAPLKAFTNKATNKSPVDYYDVFYLQDKIRDKAYNAALNKLVKGKRVLGIGSGTGLLAMMAARAGASHVYGCEISKFHVELARTLAEDNGFKNITYIHKDAAKLTLEDTDGTVDVILHENMGATLFADSINKVMPQVVKTFATADTKLLPHSGVTKVCLAYSKQHDNNWDEIAGFKYSPLTEKLVPEVLRGRAAYGEINRLSEPIVLHSFKYSDFPEKEMDLLKDKTIELAVTEKGRLNTVWFWWDVAFDEANTVSMTSEDKGGLYVGHKDAVHFSQYVQPLYRQPIDVVPGDVIVLTPVETSETYITFQVAKK